MKTGRDGILGESCLRHLPSQINHVKASSDISVQLARPSNLYHKTVHSLTAPNANTNANTSCSRPSINMVN
jgi:hypothetical protein